MQNRVALKPCRRIAAEQLLAERRRVHIDHDDAGRRRALWRGRRLVARLCLLRLLKPWILLLTNLRIHRLKLLQILLDLHMKLAARRHQRKRLTEQFLGRGELAAHLAEPVGVMDLNQLMHAATKRRVGLGHELAH